MFTNVQIVVHFREQIFQLECEYSTIHSFLCKIPQDLPFNELITKSLKLLKNYPPRKLENIASSWENTYPYSWIKGKTQVAKIYYQKDKWLVSLGIAVTLVFAFYTAFVHSPYPLRDL